MHYHFTGAMLQKLKLMLNLETIALRLKQATSTQQAYLADELAASAAAAAAANSSANLLGTGAGGGGKALAGSLIAIQAASRGGAPGTARPNLGVNQLQLDETALWTKRLDQVQVLLSTATQLHGMLLKICEKTDEVCFLHA